MNTWVLILNIIVFFTIGIIVGIKISKRTYGKHVISLWVKVGKANKIINNFWVDLPNMEAQLKHPANGWIQDWWMLSESIPIYKFISYQNLQKKINQ